MKLSRKNAIIAAGLLSASALTGTMAYYSGYTTKKANEFTIVAGKKNQDDAGEILEPNWNPDNAENLQPNGSFPKDPQLKSNIKYDAWAFIKIEMPTIKAQIEGENEEDIHDCFNYEINEDWVLIHSENTGKSDSLSKDSVYVYAYTRPLPPGETTTPLFD